CKRPECTVGCDCDRFLEIWNLVFMQFERSADGKMSPLPKPSIDTGMGLERLTAVMQNKLSNFDSDIFREIIQTAADIAKVVYHRDNATDTSLRVIADHSRAAAFLISDGVLPSNEGRGYVLRRIVRRAIRHGHLLGIKDIFFYRVCESVVKKMGGHYQELQRNLDLIRKATRHEEERFRETLEKGLDILKSEFDRMRKENINTLKGETVFRLYDTYGFPVDLTSIIAQENGFVIDALGFEKEMERQRERSEWKGSGESTVGQIYKELKRKDISTLFTGYEREEDTGRLLAIIHDGRLVESLEAEAEAELVFDRTPFYGESGGQVGDTGVVEGESLLFEVLETSKVEDIIVQKGRLRIGRINVGDNLYQRIDALKRSRIRAAHSATHLLHRALRKILGEHVRQAGSLVEADRLRFDFSHFEQIGEEVLERIEEEVNSETLKNLDAKVE
ncbi:MAG: alanine--tRNA ligase, partial [Deltaproteobacteria bacterium]|nr:alanine--tRNA ligase [Deltaproteobacteria bacterium]